MGSLDEIEEYTGTRPKDLHKEFLDPLVGACRKCYLSIPVERKSDRRKSLLNTYKYSSILLNTNSRLSSGGMGGMGGRL
jgi:hypothetical protein